MKIETTERGFEIANFKDSRQNECSIQKSSAAEDDYIWLGIDNPRLTIFEDERMGKYINTNLPKNWAVSSRMHLSREQVNELLPVLITFSETGNLL
jgi:hypothetical protein